MTNPYARYKNHSVTGKDQLELMLMLYDGAIGFLQKARKCMIELADDTGDCAGRAGRIEEAHDNLTKAKRIVVYLITSLNVEDIPPEGEEVVNNLLQLYMFCYERIGAANLKKEAEEAEAAIAVIEKLREGWADMKKAGLWQPQEASSVFEDSEVVIAEA